MITRSDFVFSFCWGPRKETAAKCATRLAKCLARLCSMHPVFAELYDFTRTRESEPLTPDEGVLKKKLSNSMIPADYGSIPIIDLGFNYSFWNAAVDAVTFNVNCGSVSEGNYNTFNVSFNSPTSCYTSLLSDDFLIDFARLVVECWEPLHGIFYHTKLDDSLDHPEFEFTAHVGWMTYLSSPYGELPKLAPPAHSIEMPGGGHLVLPFRNVAKANGPEHLEEIRKLTKLLKLDSIIAKKSFKKLLPI